MRAYCDKHEIAACKRSTFQDVLLKKDGCLPGDWKCIGFQEMFGGPKGLIECAPWDLQCTLLD